jgi:diguanylate cyclase (GGDEF)-like protein/putative nucleotidyltransferase with HDIG domain
MERPTREIPLQDVRVLVLDDDDTVRKLCHTILVGAGCTVESAMDGREGLQILIHRDFDVIILDLRMEKLGGLAFLEQTRQIWPWLGIVILSGYVDDESKDRAKELGVHRLLEKPVKPDDLRNHVLDEAREKRRRVELPATVTLDRIKQQLDSLRHFSEMAISAESLDEALRNLSTGISRLLPCSVVGVLNVMQERLLVMNVMEPVSQRFLDMAEREVFRTYEAVTGEALPEDSVHIQFTGISCFDDGPESIGSSFMIPLLNRGQVTGLLTLAVAQEHAYTTANIPFLYHAGNLLSTVLISLNRIRQFAVRDVLTGLFNRRGVEEELERMSQLCFRLKQPMGVAAVDVDFFKSINDTFGHLIGDQVLRELAGLLRKDVRTSDVIGRYGGDEMVILFPQVTTDQLLKIGDEVIRSVRSHVFCESTTGVGLTISVGVASTEEPDVKSSADLLVRADQALYKAKQAGRDRVCAWSMPTLAAALHLRGPSKKASTKRAPRGSLLVVDDDPEIGKLLNRVLKKDHYDVVVVTTAEEALKAIESEPGRFDIMLTDVGLPGESGHDLLGLVSKIDESIVKIVITGMVTADNAIVALRNGAYEFIKKPIEFAHLKEVCERALNYRRLMISNTLYQRDLEKTVREKSAALARAMEQFKMSYNFTLEALIAMLDAKAHETGIHSTRVRDLAMTLARYLGLPERDVEVIGRGALLHDIGKIAIPDSILHKAGPLTEEERKIMRTHPEIGYRILRSSPFLEESAEIVRSHHEWYDGTGYPRGIKGEDIAVGARIFSLVDAYDAMRSGRVYNKARSVGETITEIKKHAGKQFDPHVVEAFLKCQPQLEEVAGWAAEAEFRRSTTG